MSEVALSQETPCFSTFSEALFAGPEGLDRFEYVTPASTSDLYLSLLKIYSLHTGELNPLDGEARYAGHPATATLRWRLENQFFKDLENIGPVPQGLVATSKLFSSLSNGAPTYTEDSSLLVVNAALTAVSRSWLTLSRSGASAPIPAFEAFGFMASPQREVPQMGFAQYPDELLAMETLAGFLTLNHWLVPQALGALAAHLLISSPRLLALNASLAWEGVPSSFTPLDASTVLEELEILFSRRPDWVSHLAQGACWYVAFDDELMLKLSRM